MLISLIAFQGIDNSIHNCLRYELIFLVCPILAKAFFNCKNSFLFPSFIFSNSSITQTPEEPYFLLPKYQSLEWDCPIKIALMGLITEAGDEQWIN